MSVMETVHAQWDGEPTVVLSRRVRPGHEAEFQAWAGGFSDLLGAFPGCRKCQVVPPVTGAQPEWVFVSTFENPAALKGWLASETRRQWLEQVEPMVENTGQMRVISGLETLFGLLPPGENKPPPVWKLATVTLAGLFPTIVLSGLYVTPRLMRFSLVPRGFLTAVFMVAVMTWVVMPVMTRIFRPWLFPGRP